MKCKATVGIQFSGENSSVDGVGAVKYGGREVEHKFSVQGSASDRGSWVTIDDQEPVFWGIGENPCPLYELVESLFEIAYGWVEELGVEDDRCEVYIVDGKAIKLTVYVPIG